MPRQRLNQNGMKWCAQCRSVKDVGEFSFTGPYSLRRAAYCKPCATSYRRMKKFRDGWFPKTIYRNAMLYLKSCPKCKGDVEYSTDPYHEVKVLLCLGCGWRKESAIRAAQSTESRSVRGLNGYASNPYR